MRLSRVGVRHGSPPSVALRADRNRWECSSESRKRMFGRVGIEEAAGEGSRIYANVMRYNNFR